MSHVTHMSESCHTYARVTHTKDLYPPCGTHKWVMSRIRMSHVTHLNEACDTYDSPPTGIPLDPTFSACVGGGLGKG